MLYFLQQLMNGLHIGAIYALLAFGYALTNGVLHRTNLAHGALFGFAGQFMILSAVYGWQTLWLILPVSLAFGIAVSIAVSGFVAFVLARSILGPLAGRSPNTIAATTLGVSLVLMELGRIAADTKDFWLPPMLSEPVVFAQGAGFQVTMTVLQVINCAIAVAAMLLAWTGVNRSRFGRLWRAVSDDPAAAEMCGVDTRAVFRGAVVGGGMAAALAGMLAAVYYGNISFGTGLFFGLKVLFITAVGGYRAPARAAGGAALFGIAESLWSGYFPIEWRDAWMFLFLVLLLVLRADATEEPTRAAYLR